jgi:FkbM family methyltransferase
VFDLVISLYRILFARKIFYVANKALYHLSLRGLGILNYESDLISGEKSFVSGFFQNNEVKQGVIFDVGANVGNYSALIRSFDSEIKVYAFEPHPITYSSLEKKASALNVTSVNAAVGAEIGDITLYDYHDKDGSSHASVYQGVIEDIHKGDRPAEHKCKVLTLDSFCAENDIVDIELLKIDVEGHEISVLLGAEGLIKSKKIKAIHFEFNEMNIESRIYFKDFWDILDGYDFYRMLPHGLVPIKNYSPVFCEIFAYQNIVALLRR